MRLNFVPHQYSNILPGREEKMWSKLFYLRFRFESPGSFSKFMLKGMSAGGGKVMFVGRLRLNAPLTSERASCWVCMFFILCFPFFKQQI